MTDFDGYSLLEFRKRRSHGLRQKGNNKRKMIAVKGTTTLLKAFSKELTGKGRHPMLSFLSSLPIGL